MLRGVACWRLRAACAALARSAACLEGAGSGSCYCCLCCWIRILADLDPDPGVPTTAGHVHMCGSK